MCRKKLALKKRSGCIRNTMVLTFWFHYPLLNSVSNYWKARRRKKGTRKKLHLIEIMGKQLNDCWSSPLSNIFVCRLLSFSSKIILGNFALITSTQIKNRYKRVQINGKIIKIFHWVLLVFFKKSHQWLERVYLHWRLNW